MSKKQALNDVKAILHEWVGIYEMWQEQYEALQVLTKCGPEAPITAAMGKMWDAYSGAIARELGVSIDWLDWYCWENDMGAKGLEVKIGCGKPVRVRTVAHLARVICE